MSSIEFSSFFERFGVDLENPSKDFNYSTLVLGDNVKTLPFQVARILTSPRGPTSAQDGLIWVVVPYIVEDDVQQLASMVSDKSLPSWSIDMRTGKIVEHTADTLVVNPEWFVNSILLACHYYLSKGQEEIAYKMMQYIEQIMPYIGMSLTWTITPADTSKPFSHIGNIATSNQLLNPYIHQEEIFPNTTPPHIKLS